VGYPPMSLSGSRFQRFDAVAQDERTMQHENVLSGERCQSAEQFSQASAAALGLL
jgi:hypothetical protein